MNMDDTWVRVAETSELEPTGRSVWTDPAEGDILVVRCGDRYLAVAAWCTHVRAALHEAHIDGHEIECPLHGALFDLESGRALTPPAIKSLKTYPVQVVDDHIYLQIVR